MGCFVRGDKNCMAWQIDAGCFVRGVKKWHGMFCPGMFCPTFVLTESWSGSGFKLFDFSFFLLSSPQSKADHYGRENVPERIF